MEEQPTDREILLIGDLKHSHTEWGALRDIGGSVGLKEFKSGTREEFFSRCDSGEYDRVVALYRSNDSTKVTGLFDQELVKHLPSSLKYICHNGSGYDNIDVPACTSRGIQVSHTPEVVNDATADTAIFVMLGALRLANLTLTSLRRGQWRGPSLPLGRDPRGKLLGILGMGSIGRAVASRARAFGMKVQYHNRSKLDAELEDSAEFVDFETLLSTSDVLSLNCNLTMETTHIIGKRELLMMKDGAVLVNTARGKLVDEAALVEVLNTTDKIWSVGLDVFEDEPQIQQGLIANDRVFLLPHIGTATFETQKSMELLVIDNIKNALMKGELLTRVKEQADMK
ncbi:D-3-phosphoglycerate dehydrogenase [Thozetella sp. PMI_491]|nr:D-3-phosphoglycerate dehydrogenase [Thozetella sp. PMI_491]